MINNPKCGLPVSGRFSPLRYPGGKGKLAKFISELIRINGLQDGLYVEPYAGGAAVALELLLTGIVRQVHINDLSRPIYAFWHSVLNSTEELLRLVHDTPLNLETWMRMKFIFSNGNKFSDLDLGYATFYLNRTNRSGILNGGPIGGRAQAGLWNIDARYNRDELSKRVERIAQVRKRILLTNVDAAELIKAESKNWPKRALIYLDPPYFNKGQDLYYNFYKADDHSSVAEAVSQIQNASWVVSYDDVKPIHHLYSNESWLQYEIGYSARQKMRGREAMFFRSGMEIPDVQGSMIEIARWNAIDGEGKYRAPISLGV